METQISKAPGLTIADEEKKEMLRLLNLPAHISGIMFTEMKPADPTTQSPQPVPDLKGGVYYQGAFMFDGRNYNFGIAIAPPGLTMDDVFKLHAVFKDALCNG